MKIKLNNTNKYIGDNERCFIIAEAGINHCGQLDMAKQLIDIALESKADCVKFQKRTINRILTKEGLDMLYNSIHSYGDTYGKHKEALEFTNQQFIELKKYADNKGILFTASGWDEESVDFLDSLDIPFFKMASADLTNIPLLEHTAKKGKPIIISTGMADFDMVNLAYKTLKQYNNNICILQCTSSYPCPDNQIHLNVMKKYKDLYPDTVIGYSGHEKGIAISLAAVAMGAKIIERHYTIDRTLKGSDHAASLEVSGLTKMIRDIRIIENAFGSYDKQIQLSEEGCIKKLRKSLVSDCHINEGTIITRNMLTTKGPGTGISPARMNEFINKIAVTDIDVDIIIRENMFC